MKIYVLLLSLAITVKAAEWKPLNKKDFATVVDTCFTSFNLSAEQRKEAVASKYPVPEAMPAYICILKGFQVWDDSQGFIVDRIMVIFDQSIKDKVEERATFRKNFESCLDENPQKSSPVEWGIRNLKCFADKKEVWDFFENFSFYDLNEKQE